MNHQELRHAVRNRLDEANLSAAWLARQIGTSRQNLSNWLNGADPVDPTIWTRLLAAIPTAPLENPTIPVGFPLVQMPLAGTVPAGTWGDPLASEDFIEVEAKFEHRERFAARVIGDSCYPALQQGDLTIWHSDLSPQYGLIVLAQRRGDHGCTVKQLDYDESAARPVLRSINPAHLNPDDGDGWGAIARLVGVIRNHDGLEQTWFLDKGLRPSHFGIRM